MNRSIRKSLAWLLVLALLVSLAALSASAASAKVPTVYLAGYGSGILADKTDASSDYIFPAQIPEDFASTVVKRVAKPMLKGATLNRWDDFHKEVVDLTVEAFGGFALDHNGEASDGSGHPDYSYTYPLDDRKENGVYDLYAYHFEYDWRLDPFENAAILNEYILGVCEATGFQKVNLIGRCLGANIILAYLHTYGYDHVDQVCYYAAGFKGFESIGALFTGEIDFDCDAIPDYLDNSGRDQLVGSDRNPTYDLLVAVLQYLNAAKTLKLAELAFDNYLIPEFQKYILPDMMRQTFATFPSFWSFIGDEYYDQAMKLIFGGHEKEYAAIIEKADHYHNDIMAHTDDIILDSVAHGVETYILVKYGSRMVPIVKQPNTQSDSTVFTSNSSHGAVTAPLYGSFSDEFVRGVKTANKGKYLSPDHTIDASSCLLPDHTWFLKNVYHQQNPDAVETMIGRLFDFDGYTTVFDLEEYPQYLVYDVKTDTLAPMAQDAAPSKAPKYRYFKSKINLFKKVIALLKKDS